MSRGGEPDDASFGVLLRYHWPGFLGMLDSTCYPTWSYPPDRL